MANVNMQSFYLPVEGKQADEAIACIIHTILLYRILGKFSYNREGKYSVGSIGYTDIDCDFIDLTYVCCTCDLLNQRINRDIRCFSDQLRGNEGTGIGQITLEFFHRNTRTGWLRPQPVQWEVWNVRLELVTLNTEEEKLRYRAQVGELLADKIFSIAEIINRQEYRPSMPCEANLDLVFDTSYTDIQPYLFNVNYSISGPSSGSSLGSSVRRFFRENLSF